MHVWTLHRKGKKRSSYAPLAQFPVDIYPANYTHHVMASSTTGAGGVDRGSGTAGEIRASDALQPSSSNNLPATRRSVSFGPASMSPAGTNNGTVPTILDQTAPAAAGSSISGGSTTPASRVPSTGSNHSASNANSMPGAASMTPSNSATGATALKPALKAGTERKRLPPPAQYQHPDPLVRRLRLVDDKGNPVNLKEFFRGATVVAFYFSSQWAGQPLKEYHNVSNDYG